MIVLRSMRFARLRVGGYGLPDSATQVVEWVRYLQKEPPAPEVFWKISFRITPTILVIIGMLLVTVIVGGRDTVVPAFILIIFAFLFAFSRQKIVRHHDPDPPGLRRSS